MATTQTMSLQLEEKTVRAIEMAVESGKYASPEEFVAKAVALFQRDDFHVPETIWRQAEEVCDRMDSDPARGYTVEQVKEHLGLYEEDEEEKAARAA